LSIAALDQPQRFRVRALDHLTLQPAALAPRQSRQQSDFHKNGAGLWPAPASGLWLRHRDVLDRVSTGIERPTVSAREGHKANLRVFGVALIEAQNRDAHHVADFVLAEIPEQDGLVARGQTGTIL